MVDPGRASHRVPRSPQRLTAPHSGSAGRPIARIPLFARIPRGPRHPDSRLSVHGTSDSPHTLQSSLNAGRNARTIAEDLIEDGKQVAAEDVGRNKAMAKWGGDWLVEQVKGGGGTGDGLNVLTVCNTGSLATSVRNVSTLVRMIMRPT